MKLRFYALFFFFLHVICKIRWFYCIGNKKNIVYIMFTYYSRTVYGSYNTIHIFKNYFTIIFLIFKFINNKIISNESILSKYVSLRSPCYTSIMSIDRLLNKEKSEVWLNPFLASLSAQRLAWWKQCWIFIYFSYMKVSFSIFVIF